MLRIISVNAWNSANDRELRTKNLVHLIQNRNIDILCIQNADKDWNASISAAFNHFYIKQDENMLVASRYPISKTKILDVKGIPIQLIHINGEYNCDSKNIVIANIFLPRDCEKEKIACLFRRIGRIKHQNIIITGNFNCTKFDIPNDLLIASDDPTWPSWKTTKLPVQLDWTLLRLNNFTLEQGSTLRGVYISDHLPILIELTEKGQKN